MSKLSVSRAWDESRMILARDGRLFAAVALALVVLPQTVIGLVAPASPGATPGTTMALFAVTIVIGLIAQIALNRLAIGPSTTVGAAIGRGVARMPAMLGAFILLMIVLFLVLIPVVLVLAALGAVTEPGVGHEAPPSVIALILLVAAFCYAIFQLTIPVAAAEGGGPVHLMARSWRLARGSYFRLLGFVLLVFIGLIVVVLAGQLGIGSIVALTLGPPDPMSLSALVISLVVALIQAFFTVLFAVMLARIYLQLAESSVQPSVPKSGI
ncbi:MAG TPA: glycerophosphoryl diester phosphodiesterase membrane domain-containing protein [Sphingomicrobium sp.]|jgi:hypothetical protein|nr:glycerophosphoryl diester phosphodiesterase membrane domain-containing protein [Sphingomicrobium sp.]